MIQIPTLGIYKSREQFLKVHSVRGERKENTDRKGGTVHEAIKTTKLFWKENETKMRECVRANLTFRYSFRHCIIVFCNRWCGI